MSKRTRSKRGGSFQAKFFPGAALIGSYRPLATPVHRVPLWLKACLFAAFMLLLALTGWQVAFGVCAVCLILAYSAGIKTMELLRMLYAMRWLHTPGVLLCPVGRVGPWRGCACHAPSGHARFTDYPHQYPAASTY